MRNTPTKGEQFGNEDKADQTLQNANQGGRQSAHLSQSKHNGSEPLKQSISSDDQTVRSSFKKGRLSMASQGIHEYDKAISASERVVEGQEKRALPSHYQLQLMLLEQQKKKRLLMAKQEHWREQIALAKEGGKETCTEQQSSSKSALADYRAQLMLLEHRRSQVHDAGQEVDDRPVAESLDPQSHNNLVSHTSSQPGRRKRAEWEVELHERGSASRAFSPKCMYRASNAQDDQSGLNISESSEGTPPAVANSQIFEGRIKDAQSELKAKLIFQQTEDSFRKRASDQRSVVIPTHRVLPSGSVLFKHTKDLGRGHLGAVDKVEPAGEQNYFPGKVYARKTLTIARRQQGTTMTNELVRLESARTLCHPHLPTVIMTYEQDVGFHALRYGILMNLVAKYTLSSFLESSSNTDSIMRPLLDYVKKWIGCLASALSYVHAKGILHRRIKPSSILVENGEIFFTEFAISNHFKDTHMLMKNDSDSNVEVDIYKAPEVEMQQSSSPKADTFSLACVYIEMLATLSGTPPVELGEPIFEDRLPLHSHHSWRRQALLAELDTHGRLPPFLQDFVKCCRNMILYDPDARPSAFQVAKSIVELHVKVSEGDIGANLECECLSPWQSNEEEGCRLLM